MLCVFLLMNRLFPLAAVLALAPFTTPARAAPRESDIVFTQPGKIWEAEALPVGNGRIGAMIFGGPVVDRIQFNEISLRTGDDNRLGDGYSYGKDDKGIFGAYQNFGDLFVCFGDASGKDLETGSSADKVRGAFGDAMAASKAAANTTAPEGYRRDLNLSTARVTTVFAKDGVNFRREAFASAPDEVIVLRYTADKPGAHSGYVALKEGRDVPVKASGDLLAMSSALKNGIAYGCRVKVLHQGGTVTADGDRIVFKGCDSLTLVLAARTNYKADLKKRWVEGSAEAKLDADFGVLSKPYDVIRAAAEKANRTYMDLVSLDIGDTPADLLVRSTPERLAKYRQGGDDPDLKEDLFNFSRYLLIGSSRNSLPANLQGLWNDSNKPAWGCDYHTNINIQMNYWGAEPIGLPEAHLPLVNYVIAQAPAARLAVLADKRQFPKPVRGWTARTSQNITGGNGWQ